MAPIVSALTVSPASTLLIVRGVTPTISASAFRVRARFSRTERRSAPATGSR